MAWPSAHAWTCSSALSACRAGASPCSGVACSPSLGRAKRHPIYSNTIPAYGQQDNFSTVVTDAAGDTVDFLSGTGSAGCSECYLSTDLQTIIQASVLYQPAVTTCDGAPSHAILPPVIADGSSVFK